MMEVKRNERDWAGQLISWIKAAIEKKTTVFQEATNDTGVKMESGRTKFPDILLFTDKISGVVFNGWELKFPDTAVDDAGMLENALEKARKLRSESFVTWNGAEAVIWKFLSGYRSLPGAVSSSYSECFQRGKNGMERDVRYKGEGYSCIEHSREVFNAVCQKTVRIKTD